MPRAPCSSSRIISFSFTLIFNIPLCTSAFPEESAGFITAFVPRHNQRYPRREALAAGACRLRLILREQILSAILRPRLSSARAVFIIWVFSRALHFLKLVCNKRFPAAAGVFIILAARPSRSPSRCPLLFSCSSSLRALFKRSSASRFILPLFQAILENSALLSSCVIISSKRRPPTPRSRALSII